MDSPASHDVGTTFAAERLDVIARREHDHFWHEPRRRLLLQTLADADVKSQGPLLDVGCGTGALVHELSRQGYDAQGVDPWVGARNLPGEKFRQGTINHLPFPDATFASVCAFDVIEHVEEAEAFREISRVLQPGGRLFVSVPAHAFLWSPRDDRAGHRRRYSRASLGRSLAKGGYRVVRLFGFQFLLLPAMAIHRITARQKNRLEAIDHEDEPAAAMNRWLRRVNLAEIWLGRFWRPPTGTSLIAVARRT